MVSDIRVISLDLDGVLFDGESASFVIGQQLGLAEKYMALFQKMERENMTFHEIVSEGALIWKGIAVDGRYDNLVESLPLMEGARESISTLKKWGYEVGSISSGVSQFFMNPMIRRLNLDFAYSNILGSKDGTHDGSVEYFMDGPQKAETILNYVEEKGYSRSCIASVGNGFNDIELFRVSTFSVAFNPVNKIVSDSASVTVKSKDLSSILPFFERN
ncbi:MAG: HAD family hydrolase [Candidatus Thorarchaeota archaeon]